MKNQKRNNKQIQNTGGKEFLIGKRKDPTKW